MPATYGYLYAESRPDDPPHNLDGGRLCIGKIVTNSQTIVELLPLLLGATTDGRRVTRLEVGKPDRRNVLDAVYTLATEHPNAPEGDR
ncbi:hypothetical protein AB0M10_15140 [Streptomyces sp. NPDC051840]|uniref:hypothetical protein n=1 Tax=Streptomyces sp. NPDC051840 TaxID=3154752 RepID=UPI003447FCCB